MASNEDGDMWLFLEEPDILKQILKSLTNVNDILACRQVCKAWRNEIESHGEFWKKVLKGQPDFISACRRGSFEAVSLYFQHGRPVHVNKSTKKGSTPLQAAAFNKKSSDSSCKITELLLKEGALVDKTSQALPVTPLFIAVDRWNVDTVKLLIQKGANVNEQGKFFTPLQLAAYGGYPKQKRYDIVKILLDSGALINYRGEYLAPLDIARQRWEREICHLLIR